MGNSPIASAMAWRDSVHPHGRGELSIQPWQIVRPRGSSPRAWGTPSRGFDSIGCWRFIPTGVGNSWATMRSLVPVPVHPHGRGELSRCQDKGGSSGGSSPRAWGTPSEARATYMLERFIPTGVGNSLFKDCCLHLFSVHPHGRGELLPGQTKLRPQSGSSPRAWGTPVLCSTSRGHSRFIPTGVGNSLACINAHRLEAVHPHGRGELNFDYDEEGLYAGSSPRARGTPAALMVVR